MKKSYRLHIEGLYKDALKSVKVQPKRVKAHKDASATIPSNEKIVAAVKGLPNVEILAEGKTEITFRIPAAVAWHNDNPPNFTPEQRQQAEAERAARKTARAAKRAAQDDDEDDDEDDEDEPDDEAGEEQSQ